MRTVVEEIGYGALAGALAGAAGAALLGFALRRDLANAVWTRVGVAATAAAAYGLAVPLGGSGFIAAFVGARSSAASSRRTGVDELATEPEALVEELGAVLDAATFVVFGAVILGPTLGSIGWDSVLYAVLSLTVVRMVPVAIALIGSGARPATVAFLGWFGPHGLASIVFAVIVVSDADLLHTDAVVTAVITTIALSVVAHGMSAVPAAEWYSRWYTRHPEREMLMEGRRVARQRWRRRTTSSGPT